MKNLQSILHTICAIAIVLIAFETSAQVTDTGDQVGIGNPAPIHKLDVNGDVNLSLGSKLLINSRPVVSTVGAGNTFIGDLSGNAITTGSNNAFIGYKSGEDNTSGHSNAFIGFKAGEFNTTGFSNAFIGQQAGRANLTGKTNVMIGRRAGFTSATGDDNVFIGHLSGDSNNGGSSNTYLGSGADGSPTLTNATAVGANAVVSQDSSVVLGNGAKVGIGTSAPGYDLDVAGDMNFTGTLYQNGIPFSSGGSTGPTGATGVAGPQGPTGPAGAPTTFIQDSDGNTKVQTEETSNDDIIRFDLGGTEYFRMQGPRLEVDNSNGSVFIGDSAGAANQFSYYNTFVGGNAGKSNTSGYRNAAFGLDALKDNTEGQYNAAFGVDAMHDNTTGRDNTALGWGALKNGNTADNNTSVGALTLFNSTSGSHNVAMGHSALYANTSGDQNVSIGYSSGANALGSGNVFLGYSAGFQENGSNRLYIENSAANASDALIYGEFDNDLLRVNGTLNIDEAYSFPTVDGTSGQVLRTDGSGNLSWQTISGGTGSTGPTGPTGASGANGATGPTGPTGDSYWNQSGSNINYTAGNVAIGTPSTTHRLEIDGSTISTQAVADIDVAYTGNSNVQALNTYSVPNPGYGYGLFSTGGNIGVYGSNPGAGFLGNSYAVKGYATGTGGNRYAIHGEASNPGGNFAVGLYGWGGNATVSYGVWGAATGGTTNWAGYFAQGNVHIQNDLGIGTTSPGYDLDVSGDINFTGDLYQNGVLFSGGGGSGLPSGAANLTLHHDGNDWAATGVLSNNGTNIGIGTVNPSSKLNVVGDTASGSHLITSHVNYSGNSDVIAVQGNSITADGYGIGIQGIGGYRGVQGTNSGGAYSGSSYAVYGYATGTAGSRYALYGFASNPGGTSAYGVYGSATGAVNNWAGYFAGNTYVSGDLLVGTTTGATGYKVSVDGGIMCEEIKVQDSGSWPDYVFDSNYNLRSLEEVEAFIEKESHLPGVPDACTVEEEGINLGEMQKLMMEKIEEGMLYTLQLKKEIDELKAKNEGLEAKLNER